MDRSVSESVAHRGTARVARWSVRHRWLVIAVWLVAALAGGVAAGQSGGRLTFRFDLPGQPAFETNAAIVSHFGSGGDNPPLVAVVRLPSGRTVDSPGVDGELAGAFGKAAQALPGARTASYPLTKDRGFVSADGRTTFALFYPIPDFTSSDPYSKAVPAMTRALAGVRVAGTPVHVTGASVLASGGSSSGNSVLVETLFAGVAALVVLAVVFGSLLALLPMLIAAVAIPSAFVVIYALTYVTTMSTLVQNIVALVGLGVAIDYALLVVTRWREERASTSPSGPLRGGGTRNAQARAANREAVVAAAATAGSSVVFSGITVAVSLAALALTTVPFLRSIGLAGLLIPLFSIGVTTTLLPVILDAVGPRLEWPRRRPASTVSRMWTAIARWVVAHRVIAAAGSLALLGLLIAPVAGLTLGEPQARATASTASADARSGFEALDTSGIGAGVLRPTEVLMPADGAYIAPEGTSATAPAAWRRGGLKVVDAWSPADASSGAGKDALGRIRQSVAGVPGSRVGGSPAQDADFIDALYGRNLVIIAAVIVVLTVLLLARALRSLWLPVKALLLNVLSLAAAFGVLTFVWQEGHATSALFGTPATGAVTLWVPLAVFALLFGLSMDYEVFILSRINEEYGKGLSTDDAVVSGIGHTGRLVTSGALILCLAFVALGGVPQTDVKILSTGLAAGIILDATVIRGVLAPALVALFGRANWWMPRWAARLLRVAPLTSPEPPESRPAPSPSPGRA
ncbi:MMPL family transporter [Actinacidiphila rubida]|uniref:Putative drug exporter of the RND superfamily n=1 Tax=Actinacidiphila rubida TaxID=310780 RepID=A0A1H8IZG3_9ACTN|nr:MMPL family transporter [Actinacidiphila rubida]SEN74013.1 putative drug exporter of the RND superfamily [Actinacidiphila rubida]